MKVHKYMCPLMADLEYIIGSTCYNPNSYDGHTGDEGCAYKYPVVIPTQPYKTKTKINLNYALRGELSPDDVWLMRYEFGSNHLYIGQSLIKLLEYLEDRYNISFNDLERNRKK